MYFLVETGFRHVGRSGLELLTSSDLSALASQSAGIPGVSHCAQPHFDIFSDGKWWWLSFAEKGGYREREEGIPGKAEQWNKGGSPQLLDLVCGAVRGQRFPAGSSRNRVAVNGAGNTNSSARVAEPLICFVLIEMGFHHVGQAGLELLTSGYHSKRLFHVHAISKPATALLALLGSTYPPSRAQAEGVNPIWDLLFYGREQERNLI
ncbi:hypothetical protein AAY473_026464 [Plecturocebus cupreus]